MTDVQNRYWKKLNQTGKKGKFGGKNEEENPKKSKADNLIRDGKREANKKKWAGLRHRRKKKAS